MYVVEDAVPSSGIDPGSRCHHAARRHSSSRWATCWMYVIYYALSGRAKIASYGFGKTALEGTHDDSLAGEKGRGTCNGPSRPPPMVDLNDLEPGLNRAGASCCGRNDDRDGEESKPIQR